MLPAWSEDDRLYGPVLGMYAFGLEESGDYARAEEVGSHALAARSEETSGACTRSSTPTRCAPGSAKESGSSTSGWCTGPTATTSPVHNWWHYALFNLEAGNLETVRRIYDERLFVDSARRVAVKMCDASALLWRLLLDGVEEPERWRALADVWATLTREPCFAFNDMHAMMAFVGAAISPGRGGSSTTGSAGSPTVIRA